MFNITSTHTLQKIERLHLEEPSADQVQTPAPLKAHKHPIPTHILAQVLSYV